MKIAEKLKLLIGQSGMKQTQIGMILNINQSGVSKSLRRGRVLKPHEMVAIADLAGCTVRYLADDRMDVDEGEPNGPRGVRLAPELAELMDLVRELGVVRAKRRLLNLPDSEPCPSERPPGSRHATWAQVTPPTALPETTVSAPTPPEDEPAEKPRPKTPGPTPKGRPRRKKKS